MLIPVFLLGIFWEALAQAPVPAPTLNTLCTPAIVASRGNDLWDMADELVEHRRYSAAARAYYQVFRCDDTGGPINPLVRDYHQLQPFDSAVRQAAAGNFLAAASELRRVLTVLHQFGEARFLMGVFQWSAGQHSEARDTWRATINAPYFTMPPDFNQTPRVVSEAKKFLAWSSK